MSETVTGNSGSGASERRTTRLRTLLVGSDVEIAEKVRDRLEEEFGALVYDDGGLWAYTGYHWRTIHDAALRRTVQSFDGAVYGFLKGGEPKRISLNKSRIDSILHELGAMLELEEQGFFAKERVATGINCKSGFIRIASDGAVKLEQHDPEHRQRHVLAGQWKQEWAQDHENWWEPADDSLLRYALEGSFFDDEDAQEKIDILCEVAGMAALGYSTRLTDPRAIVLFGKSAGNGKSVFLDMLRGLLPDDAVCNISADKLGDDRHNIRLIGKLLNTSDELSGEAVASDVFKKAISGDPLDARDVYKSAVSFRPLALHVFATNLLPAFRGGVDRGVQRRILVIPFKRTIPKGERVEKLGQRIIEEEFDTLLRWAVHGAIRVVTQGGYSIGPATQAAALGWRRDADPVLAWAEGALECAHDSDTVLSGTVYAAFKAWAQDEGFQSGTLPGPRAFWSRVSAHYPGVEELADTRIKTYRGLRLIEGGRTAAPVEHVEPEAQRVPPARKMEHRQAKWHRPDPAVSAPVVMTATAENLDDQIPF